MKHAISSVFLLGLVGLASANTGLAAVPTAGKLYHLKAKHSGKCLDVTGHSIADNKQLQQWDCSGALNQTFRLLKDGDGFTLTAEESVMRVRVEGTLAKSGTEIVQSAKFDADGSKLKLNANNDGSYEIRIVDSNRCFDVADMDKDAGAKIIQWDCNGTDNQAWTFEEVRPLPLTVTDGLLIEKLDVPNLDNPRFMAYSANNDLLVASGPGKIWMLRAPYHEAKQIADFGSNAHSVTFRKTSAGEELWVGETGGLYKVLYESGKVYQRSDFKKVVSLPSGGGHSSRTVRLGPDGKIYVSLGISSNCSTQFIGETFPENDRRGGIIQLEENGDTVKLVPYGTGLRNPVGFAWHPDTKIMYANNNGPDHWGFDEPREVFVEVTPGSFFGMPFYQYVGGKVQVDRCAPAAKAPFKLEEVKTPVVTFPARNAPLDMLFVDKKQLKSGWQGSSIVALHGSWAVPASGDEAGKRPPSLQLVEFVNGKATGKVSEIVGGFQYKNGDRFARPAGLVWGPDGYLYVTSDAENPGLYRVRPVK